GLSWTTEGINHAPFSEARRQTPERGGSEICAGSKIEEVNVRARCDETKRSEDAGEILVSRVLPVGLGLKPDVRHHLAPDAQPYPSGGRHVGGLSSSSIYRDQRMVTWCEIRGQNGASRSVSRIWG